MRWLTKRKREARHFRLAPAPFWAMRPHIRAVCPVRKMEAQRSRLTSASISSCRGRTSLMTVFQMAGTRSVIELCARTSRNAAILYSLSLRRCNQDTMRPRVRIHSALLCCCSFSPRKHGAKRPTIFMGPRKSVFCFSPVCLVSIQWEARCPLIASPKGRGRIRKIDRNACALPGFPQLISGSFKREKLRRNS